MENLLGDDRPSDAKLLLEPSRDIYESDEEQETSANRMISPDTPPKIIELKNMKVESSPESPDSAKMTTREMGYGELVEKYKHYMRSSK